MIKVIENYNFVDNTYLMKLILGSLGYLKPIKDDKFRYLSSTGNEGTVSYNGARYAWCIMDGKIKVMSEAEAGWNWSETMSPDKGNWVDIDTIS